MEKSDMPREVIKRDGRRVRFERQKIAGAISKAQFACGIVDEERASALADEVADILDERGMRVPTVEQIQDVVEEVLIKRGMDAVARAYIIYRRERAELRESKAVLGVTDDLKLSLNAIEVLKSRCLLRDENGNVVETPGQMFERVARVVAEAELNYGSESDARRYGEEFLSVMTRLDFLPNSPTLMNAGSLLGQLSACFVIAVDDSIDSIFTALKQMALIHQSGGGTGFSFSRLREKNSLVRSTGGVASGPVSFIRVFDTATEVIKQGGRRRGANIAVLRVDHPDIIEFVTSKAETGELRNFNVSVGVTDDFMARAEKGESFQLVSPRTGKTVRRLRASDLLDIIVSSAWRCGDPGLLFLDEINRRNPTPALGEIETTNPCGEQPLLPYESCNLGSLNLKNMFRNNDEFDFPRLGKIVEVAVRFLDDVIDVNRYPFPKIEQVTKGNRKIGLGVMGFAEALIKLGIPYDSDEALRFAEKVMKFVNEKARQASVRLGVERGSFPNFEKSIYFGKYPALRNASLTTIAPTGTLSIIANCSSGIEPIFAVSFFRRVLQGVKLFETNELFEAIARKRGFYSRELFVEIGRLGSVRKIESVPEDVRSVFATAFDISPEWHVKMQATFQKYCDSAVAKTVNLPAEASHADVKRVYLLAHKLGCKGITVFRYGSLPEQVLYRSAEDVVEVGAGYLQCRECGD